MGDSENVCKSLNLERASSVKERGEGGEEIDGAVLVRTVERSEFELSIGRPMAEESTGVSTEGSILKLIEAKFSRAGLSLLSESWSWSWKEVR